MRISTTLVARWDLLDPCIQQPNYAVYIACLKVYVNTQDGITAFPSKSINRTTFRFKSFEIVFRL
jgi:hypothetical protein